MAMSRVVNFPVGESPGWELEDEEMNVEGSEFHSVADSLVLYQSLKQLHSATPILKKLAARDQWVSSTFPKFLTKSRSSKQAAAVAPRHDLISYGKFDMIIGPHIFPSTRLYEVRYTPQTMITPSPVSYQHTPEAPGTSMSVHHTQAAGICTHKPTVAACSEPSPVITSSHAHAVNEAAAHNLELQRLLHKAGNKTATQQELDELARILRSIQPITNPHATSAPPPVPLVALPPPAMQESVYVRDFDLVLEFQEKPSERWRVPRTVAYCERISYGEVVLSLRLPFPLEQSTDPNRPKAECYSIPIPPQLVKLRLVGLHDAAVQLFVTWCGGEDAMAANQEKLKDLKPPKYMYVPHQLADGDLLRQMQAATAPFNIKSIKPANADSGRIRRRSSVRKKTASQATKESVTLSLPIPQVGGSVPDTTRDANRVTLSVASTTPTQPPQSNSTLMPMEQSLALLPPSQTPKVGTSLPTLQDHSSIPQTTADTIQGRRERSSTPINFIGKPRPGYPPSAHIYDPTSGARLPPTSLAAILSPTSEHLPFRRAYAGDHPPPRPQSRRSTPQPRQEQQRLDIFESHEPGTSTGTEATAGAGTAPKRKRAYQRKDTQPQSFIISCRACGQTDVPLLKGGRYCRACIDAGKAIEPIPEVVLPHRSAQASMTASAGRVHGHVASSPVAAVPATPVSWTPHTTDPLSETAHSVLGRFGISRLPTTRL